MNKVAFIASGGGMACAYSAGVAWALQDLGIRPDIFIGASGSAGTVSYFACGQADWAAKLWIEEVSSPQVVKKNPLYFNIDLIVDSIKSHFAFDEIKLYDEKIDLYLATTNYKSGELKFFNNHDDIDWYEVIRASMAVPFIYNKKVIIKNEKYMDGDLNSTIDDYIDLAVSQGANKIYVCDTTTPLNLKLLKVFPISVILNFEFLRFTKLFIKKYFRFPKKFKNIEIIVFRPDKKLLFDIINNEKSAIQEKIKIGYKEVKNLLT